MEFATNKEKGKVKVVPDCAAQAQRQS